MWCARHAGKRSFPKMHAFSKWLCSKRALLFRNAPFQTCAPFPKRSFPNGGAASRRAVDGGPSSAGMAVAGRLRTPARTRRAADSDNARHGIKIQVGVVRNVQRMARAPFILLLSGARARPAPWPSPPGSASKFKPEEARWLGARSSPPPSPASLLPPPSRPIRPSFRASELPSWSTARGRSGPGLRQGTAGGDPCRSSAWEAQFIALQRCLQTGLSL